MEADSVVVVKKVEADCVVVVVAVAVAVVEAEENPRLMSQYFT